VVIAIWIEVIEGSFYLQKGYNRLTSDSRGCKIMLTDLEMTGF
jgi:hypothetical protein